MLVLVGTAVATAAALGKGTAGPAYNSLAVALSFGFILTPIVGSLGPISGAHVNPAVTLGLTAAGKFPWRDLPGYVTAQIVGAIIASMVVWAAYGHGAYYDSHLGAPSPVNGADGMQVFLVEALIAFILVLTVLFTATDNRARRRWRPDWRQLDPGPRQGEPGGRPGAGHVRQGGGRGEELRPVVALLSAMGVGVVLGFFLGFGRR